MVEMLLKNGWIVTVNKDRKVIKGGAVAIDGKKIVGVGKTEEIERRFSAETTIDVGGKIIMPGIICNHAHSHGMASIGIPLPMPSDFYEILKDWWWPFVEDKLTKRDVYSLAKAFCVEMLRTGTTCVADVMEAPCDLPGVLDVEAEAFNEVGIRGVLSFEATERISEENAELGIQENVNFVKKWNALPDSLVRGRFCVHTVFSCSPEMLRKVRRLADEYGGGIHLHVEESKYEVEFSKKKYGKLPFEHLRDIGFLGSDVLAAQCVQTSEEEIKILKEKDVKISHNLQSNMECGVGIAPVPKMVSEGITVGLGNDGLFMDMFETMRTVYLVHKGVLRDSSVLPAEKVLEMATIDGARTLGLEHEIGSIEVGKKADLIVLGLKPPAPVTAENLSYQIVAQAQGSDVETVIVDGAVLMEDGKVLSAEEEEVYPQSIKSIYEIWRRGKLI